MQVNRLLKKLTTGTVFIVKGGATAGLPSSATLLCAVIIGSFTLPAKADPCGMVPPIYTGPGTPITRVGIQQTFVFFKDGVETFVIRPGFTGKVEQFGMLIPFPNPPALRKMPDHIFPHIAAAIDPPEVIVDLRMRFLYSMMESDGAAMKGAAGRGGKRKLGINKVRVVRQEAVGMYEVAVLEAGSPAALKKWLDDHKYVYPDGMEKPCAEYVEAGWCFVAVKTKVGEKKGVQPKPGQRVAKAILPIGATFDGQVQAMGFRFKTERLVVPMRLSAFNKGKMRNVVYLLSDSPKRIRSIPEEYVVRQLRGRDLLRNVTGPLPLRIIGGTEADIPDWRRKNLKAERDPTRHNGAARDLFASDLLAVESGQLSLPHEEDEKVLLRIGERFKLRGAQIDKLNTDSLASEREKIVKQAADRLKSMTLTVIDGDFPREVLAKQNLSFTNYKMPARQNRRENYDSKTNAPGGKQQGVLRLGQIDFNAADATRSVQLAKKSHAESQRNNSERNPWLPIGLGLASMATLIWISTRRRVRA